MNKDNAKINFGILDKGIPCAFSLATVNFALAAAVAEPMGHKVCRLAGHRRKQEKEVVFLPRLQFWYKFLEAEAINSFEESLPVVRGMLSSSRGCVRS